MTERAFSLFRTVLHPVLSTLRHRAGGANMPVAPHHAVPAVHLGGVILERNTAGRPIAGEAESLAEAMYGGIYEFAGTKVEAVPDTVFTCASPGAAWRNGLLRMDWLASFRLSARPLHGLFALRLLAAWMKARPARLSRTDQIAQLFNLAMDAPAIAATQSPAAIALASAAILRALHPVSKLKAATPQEAFGKAKAMLAAHLATRQPDSQRNRLVTELTGCIETLLHNDGSLRGGSIDELCQMCGEVTALLDGLEKSGEPRPVGLVAHHERFAGYLALLTRSDGTLAFASAADLRPGCGSAGPDASRLAPDAGHARLACGQTLLLAALPAPGHAAPLRVEMSDAGKPLLWLERSGSTHRGTGSLICASGGTLLEIHGEERADERHHVALFLSGDGADLRLEDMSAGRVDVIYVLHLPDQTKLSTTHGGTGAMIVPPAGLAWQLLVRGARVACEPGSLRIIPDSGNGQPLNLALKRAARSERPGRIAKTRQQPPAAPRLI